MAVETRMMAREFLELPESNLPIELINGEVIMSPSPIIQHQDTVGNAFSFLKSRVPNGKVMIAPMDVKFDELNVVQPDVMWIAADSQCVPVEGKYWQGAPTLIVEVASSGTVSRDKKEKFHLYDKYGVQEYWMIDPALKLIEVWYHVEGRFQRLDVFGVGEVFTSLISEVDVNLLFTA